MKRVRNNSIWNKFLVLALGTTLSVLGTSAQAGGKGPGGGGGFGRMGGSNKMSFSLKSNNFAPKISRSTNLNQSLNFSNNNFKPMKQFVKKQSIGSIVSQQNLTKSQLNFARLGKSKNNLAFKSNPKLFGLGKGSNKQFCHAHCQGCWCGPNLWWGGVIGLPWYGGYYGGCYGNSGVVVVNQVPANPTPLASFPAAKPVDLEFADVQLIDAGNVSANLGPLYRVTVANKSAISLTQGFDVALVATNGDNPNAKAPFGAKRVEKIGAGAVATVDVRLPAAVNQLNRTPEGQIEPFTTLYVGIDARNEIEEVTKENNMARMARTDIVSLTDSTASN